ncbi:MAG TPA: peptidylprolyl isomerase, partial [Pseudoclavibacter sp.]|nr:peptidylprolyl isomerase [Pseudoclavibacter sp.]
PGYSYGPIENAPDDEQYSSGVIAMARTSDNAYSQGSQFFIVFGDSTIPDDSVGGYTVIGSITSGLDVITDIAAEGVADGTDSTPAETVTLSDITVE